MWRLEGWPGQTGPCDDDSTDSTPPPSTISWDRATPAAACTSQIQHMTCSSPVTIQWGASHRTAAIGANASGKKNTKKLKLKQFQEQPWAVFYHVPSQVSESPPWVSSFVAITCFSLTAGKGRRRTCSCVCALKRIQPTKSNKQRTCSEVRFWANRDALAAALGTLSVNVLFALHLSRWRSQLASWHVRYHCVY